MNIAIYARVSTDAQAKEGTIHSQIEALHEYAKTNNLTILHECIDDGFSGTTLVRPGLDQLRDLAVEESIQGVLILSPDRLSRNQTHLLVLLDEFKKRNVQVLFTTQQFDDSPEGKLMLQIHGAVAEFEHAKITDRMRRGLKYAVKKGQVIGAVAPYGYRHVPKSNNALAHWEIDPQEAEIVKLIFELYVHKRMTGTSIAEHLNSEGILPRSGIKWWGSVMYDILKNESYLGTAYMYKTKRATAKKHPQLKKYNRHKMSTHTDRPREDWIGVPVPQIIDQKTWDAAQKLLTKNAHQARRNNNKNKYLLRGLVICGECGSMAPGYVSNKKTYYSCAAKRNGNLTTKPHDDVNISVRHQPFDDKVWQGLVELLENPDNLKEQLDKRLSRKSLPSQSAKPDQTKIEKDFQRLDVQEKRILDAYREGIIELEDLKEQKAKIAKSRKSLTAKQKAAQSQQEDSGRAEITMSMLGDVSKRYHRVMTKADFATRERLANLLINSVALYSDKAVVSGNIPVYQTDVLNPSNLRTVFSPFLGKEVVRDRFNTAHKNSRIIAGVLLFEGSCPR